LLRGRVTYRCSEEGVKCTKVRFHAEPYGKLPSTYTDANGDYEQRVFLGCHENVQKISAQACDAHASVSGRVLQVCKDERLRMAIAGAGYIVEVVMPRDVPCDLKKYAAIYVDDDCLTNENNVHTSAACKIVHATRGGNVVVTGGEPSDEGAKGSKFIENALCYATSGKGTGLVVEKNNPVLFKKLGIESSKCDNNNEQVTITKPCHPLFRQPNHLTSADLTVHDYFTTVPCEFTVVATGDCGVKPKPPVILVRQHKSCCSSCSSCSSCC
jgi:hypothetical protein